MVSLKKSTFDTCLDDINNITYIVVGDTWTSRQTHAYLEDGLTDTIDIGWHGSINRLLVHGFPDGT
jgi:hypothetical protein